jgi:hypothetical protein
MLRVVTQAAADTEPVTLAEAKLHLRADGGDSDTLISALITAAREVVERQTGYALAATSYEWTPEGDRTEPLPILPGTVTSGLGVYPILFATVPGVTPAALKAAILLLVGDLFTNTEAGTEKVLAENPAVQNLMFPFRRVLP